MARFIPVDKIRKLRDASKQGDLRAKKILDMQLSGTDDFGPELENYFANPEPQAEPAHVAQEQTVAEAAQATETPYQMYLRENELKDSDDVRKEFTETTGTMAEMPETKDKEEKVLDVTELIEDENEAIRGYDDFLEKLSLISMDPNTKANISSKILKIIADERQHNVILDEIKCLLDVH